MDDSTTTNVLRTLWIEPFRPEAMNDQPKARFAEALERKGIVVDALVIGEEGSWKTPGFHIIRYLPPPSSLLGKLILQLKILKAIADSRADIVFLGVAAAHLALPAKLLRFVFRNRWKIVIDARTLPADVGTYIGGADRLYNGLRLGLRVADGFTVITGGVKQEISQRIGPIRLPTHIWETAVDPSMYDPHVSPCHYLRNTGHEFHFLYVGIVTPKRGLDIAVEGLKLLRDQGLNVGLHIVGKGPEVDMLQARCTVLQLTQHVHFWGAVPYLEVSSYVAACDAGILTLPDWITWNTSSPTKLFEYMAMAKPVLVSPIAAHSRLLAGQSFAFFMDTITPEGFRQAALRLISLSASERHALGESARTFVLQHHTWDVRAKGLAHYFRKLSGSAPNQALPKDKQP